MSELTAVESRACLFGWAVLWPGVQDSTGLNSAPRQCMLCREYQCNVDTCPGGLVCHWQFADACQQEQHLAWNPEDIEERWCSWHTAATEVSGGLICSELGHVAFCHIYETTYVWFSSSKILYFSTSSYINLKISFIFLPVDLNGHAMMMSLSWSNFTFMKSVDSLRYTELTTESYCYPHESDVTQFC